MSSYNFPNQRIPESQKTEEWHRRHIISYVGYSATDEYHQKRREIRELLFAAHGVLTIEQKRVCEAMITQRFGENFGPEYMIYPLIETHIDAIVGKYRLRPLVKKALVNNKSAIIKKLEEKVNMVFESLMRDVNEGISPKIGIDIQTENPQMEIPEDIDEFFEKDYRTISEEIAEDVLYQILEVFKEKEQIYALLRFYLVTGRCYGTIIEKNGHPSIFVPHILDIWYDQDYTQSLQDNLNMFVFDKYMTLNEIFNTWDLSEKQKNTLTGYMTADKSGEHVNNQSQGSRNYWFSTADDGNRVRVVSMNWKSRRKARFLNFVNRKTGATESKVLPDDYKERNRDAGNIEEIETEDERVITMIGPDITLAWGRVEDQMKKKSSPKIRYLSSLGVIDEQEMGTGEIRSIAKKLMPLQNFASEIMYELRLALRRIDGQAMVYDLANIPKAWGALGPDEVLKKVNFYLKRDGIQIINSKGRKNNPYASSVNVSQKGRIQEVIGLLAVVEDLAKKISGNTDEEMGQAAQYAKATVSEINMHGGYARTEEALGSFITFQTKLLERLILKAKLIYRKGDTFTFYGGDNQLKFLQITEPFFDDDIGLHIGDNRKEEIKIQKMEAMAEQAFINPNTPELMLELLKMYNADSSTEKESVFKKGVRALQEMADANSEKDREIQRQQIEAQNAEGQRRDGQHKEKLKNNLDVAEVYANNKADDTRIKEQGANLRKAAEIAAQMEKDNQPSK